MLVSPFLICKIWHYLPNPCVFLGHVSIPRIANGVLQRHLNSAHLGSDKHHYYMEDISYLFILSTCSSVIYPAFIRSNAYILTTTVLYINSSDGSAGKFVHNLPNPLPRWDSRNPDDTFLVDVQDINCPPQRCRLLSSVGFLE